MLRPRIPTMPTPTGIVTPLVMPTHIEQQHPASACTCHHPSAPAPAPVPVRPAVQMTPGTLLALVGGGTAAVLVIGAVLVSMLLAVAITAASVAVCAVVLRSLLNNQRKPF
ncbi:SpdD-like protein [Streptomyces lunaelactis]|uniref:SpdD-like protein n=1 Tax=Streptomyces lunaelactis TaxID=1535768 RepID=UPI001584EF08|nr:SpdD-like protein [Streptomyces lunaelactis]NUK70669.1 SpdD-like protein [Streptomyces lunaelactis]NUK79353.1 SpdD-like protein [Streptomyces lunaelactis]